MKKQTQAVIALVAAAGVGGAAIAANAQTSPAPQSAATSAPAPGPTAQGALTNPGSQTYPQPSTNGPPPAGPANVNVPSKMMALPTSDEDFVRAAALMNNAEIAEGRLAARRTKSGLIQQFAQRMIDDHTTAAVELDAAARKATHRYRVPARAEMPDSRAEYRSLEQASGADFDRMYVADQIPDHVNTINALQWEVDNGKDPVIKDFAVRQLPAVKNHLAMAQAYIASNGTSMTVDAGGLAVGAGGAGSTGTNPAPTAKNGTPANNPATTSNGTSAATNNLTPPAQNASPAPSPAPK